MAEENKAAMDFGPVGKDLQAVFGLVLWVDFVSAGGALHLFRVRETFFDLGFKVK